MLEPAYLNQLKLKELYAKRVASENNLFYYLTSIIEYELTIDVNEYRRIQYVSKDKKGNLLWYLCAWINRGFMIVDKLELIGLTDSPNVEGAKDMIRFIELLLCKKQFRKIVFSVVKENPAYIGYKNFVVKKGVGKVVGTLVKNCILTDGNCYNQVIFEIYKDKFEKSNYKRYI